MLMNSRASTAPRASAASAAAAPVSRGGTSSAATAYPAYHPDVIETIQQLATEYPPGSKYATEEFWKNQFDEPQYYLNYKVPRVETADQESSESNSWDLNVSKVNRSRRNHPAHSNSEHSCNVPKGERCNRRSDRNRHHSATSNTPPDVQLPKESSSFAKLIKYICAFKEEYSSHWKGFSAQLETISNRLHATRKIVKANAALLQDFVNNLKRDADKLAGKVTKVVETQANHHAWTKKMFKRHDLDLDNIRSDLDNIEQNIDQNNKANHSRQSNTESDVAWLMEQVKKQCEELTQLRNQVAQDKAEIETLKKAGEITKSSTCHDACDDKIKSLEYEIAALGWLASGHSDQFKASEEKISRLAHSVEVVGDSVKANKSNLREFASQTYAKTHVPARKIDDHDNLFDKMKVAVHLHDQEFENVEERINSQVALIASTNAQVTAYGFELAEVVEVVKANDKEKDISLMSKVEELSAATELNGSQIADLIEKLELHDNNLNGMIYTAESQKQEFDSVKEQHNTLISQILNIKEEMNCLTDGLNDTRQICEWQCIELKEVKTLVVNQGETFHDFKEELDYQRTVTHEFFEMTARKSTELNTMVAKQNDNLDRLRGSVETIETLVDNIRKDKGNRVTRYAGSGDTESYSSVDTVQLLLSEVPFVDASDKIEDDFSCGFVRNHNILTDVSNTPQRTSSNPKWTGELQESKENILWSTTRSLIEKFNPRRI